MSENTDAVLRQVASDLAQVDAQIEDARELIEVMRLAGRPDDDMRRELARLIQERDRWATVLRQRGITP